ncbi:MAG: Abi family protein [Gammaproteobacteria bacterium]|nr:MAG: Abi family protein [Gammaproteobacteria bacterium]
MRFTKPPKTFDEQIDLLTKRGMAVADRPRARHYLAHLNYYRLGAYWLPFEQDHDGHQFRPGTTFEQVLDLYVFDRELRLLVLDAIERVEVSIRTQWAYHLSHIYGPHAHLDKTLFKAKWHHFGNVDKLKREVNRSHEVFIQHLRNKYDEPLPPLWAICEIMTLGELSKWFANLRRGKDRNAIARTYDLDEVNLTSFLHHLSTVRNICAHHARLWNREFTFTWKIPIHRPAALLENFHNHGERRIYNTLVMLAYLMDQTSPNHHFKTRLHKLLKKYSVDETAMGFPENWRELEFWVTTK